MRIAILGAGSWGTALGILLARQGHEVRLWARTAARAQALHRERRHPRFPQTRFPDGLSVSHDPTLTEDAHLIFLAIPTQHIRETFRVHRFPLAAPLVNTAKGIERGTLLRVSELLREIAAIEPEHYAVLSGPSHAEEVVAGLPTAVVVASQSPELARWVQRVMSSSAFRVYTSSDVVGVELGGALKNVIAIAAGIVDGLGLGHNAKAALITRGLAEIQRLGWALGADPKTFAGLSGLGDLVVTCTSPYSRNRSVGERLACGERLEQILSTMSMVAEGIPTTEAAYALSQRTGVEMPITTQMHAVLFTGKAPQQALTELLLREAKAEYWWYQTGSMP